MTTATQGISTILDDEKAYDENPYDIFTLPPKETHMKSGKTIVIASSIPVTDAGKIGLKFFLLKCNHMLFQLTFQDHTYMTSNHNQMNIA